MNHVISLKRRCEVFFLFVFFFVFTWLPTTSWAVSGNSTLTCFSVLVGLCFDFFQGMLHEQHSTPIIHATCSSCQIPLVFRLSRPDNQIHQSQKSALLNATKSSGSSSRATWVMLNIPSKCFPLNLLSWTIHLKHWTVQCTDRAVATHGACC